MLWPVDNGVGGWVWVRGGSQTGKINFTVHNQSLHKQKFASTRPYIHIGKPARTPQGLTNTQG